MNDRIPGSCYSNPIKYKNYRIYLNDFNAHPNAWQVAFVFVHEDYDGAPDAGDDRCGYGPSIIACMNEIDNLEDSYSDDVALYTNRPRP